jgi:hypothetical protein
MDKEEKKRLSKIGRKHAAFLLGSITLWGASDLWANGTGLIIAESITLINAIVAGTITATIFHEWGHFLGARIGSSNAPVMEKTISFFFFNFKDEENTKAQFLKMSAGGPIANWLLVIAIFMLLPLDSWSQTLLLATVFSIAVSVSIFEIPVMLRVKEGTPSEIVQKRLQEAGSTPRNLGILAGAILWMVAIY